MTRDLGCEGRVRTWRGLVAMLMLGGLVALGGLPGCGGRTGVYGSSVTPDPAPGCGNGVLEPDRGEECDLDNLAGYSCQAFGFGGGALGCSSTCRFDTGACDGGADCGNGAIEANEDCDGADLGGQTCQGLGYAGGTLLCNGACRFDIEGCLDPVQCGNGTVDAGEQCDGADLAGETCASRCYAGGTLACGALCRFDEAGCFGGPVCGDGVAGCGEECDSLDLGGQTCQGLGFQQGTLACAAGCTLDLTGCTGRLWYFQEDFEDSGHAAEWSLGGDWEWGAPDGSAGEPAAAHDGLQCLGTGMHRDYRDDREFLTNLAATPFIDLQAATAPVLSFAMWLRTESCCDGGRLFIRPLGAATWEPLDQPSVPYNGQVGGEQVWRGLDLGGWREVAVDLAPFAGEVVQIGFALYSDSSVTEPGWYVDDVVVREEASEVVRIVSGLGLGEALVDGQFNRQLQATGGAGGITWSKRPGGTNDGWLQIGGSTGLLTGTANAANLGAVQVVIRAEAVGEPGNFDERVFTLTVVEGIWQESFDGGATGWTLSGDWAWGIAGPNGGCRSGACIATVLDGAYHNNQSWALCTATSPPLDLTGLTSPRLVFWSWMQSEEHFDGGNVKVSTGGPAFTVVTGVSPAYNLSLDGQPAWSGLDVFGQWTRVEADLSPWAGQTVRVQLGFRTDSSVTELGWYVDDMELIDGAP